MLYRSARILGLSLALFVSSAVAADYDPDDEGYVRQWLILAPLKLDPCQDGATGLEKVGVKNEAGLRPKLGEEVAVGNKKLKWSKYESKEQHIDFNEFLGGETEDAVAYAVCYLKIDDAAKGLSLKMGSDDQAMVWLNGKEVLKNVSARPLTKDEDSADNVTLEKGTNVIVFKVVNEKVDFSGSIRFLDKNGKPFRNFKVSLVP